MVDPTPDDATDLARADDAPDPDAPAAANSGHLAEPALPPLAALGLDPTTTAAYGVVLSGGADTTAVQTALGLAPDDAHAALERLRTLGLVHRGSRLDDPYAAVDPRVAVPALVTAQAERLVEVRAGIGSLADLFDRGRDRHDPSGLTRVVVGSAEVGDWYSRLEHRAQSEFMAFDRPPYVVASNESTQRTALRRGVRWRAVYAVASFAADGSWAGVHRLGAEGEEARVASDLPVKLAIVDRRVALVSLGLAEGAPEALVTESAPLVEALCELFESRWRSAVPVPSHEPATASVDQDWAAVAARLAAAATDASPRSGVPDRGSASGPGTTPAARTGHPTSQPSAAPPESTRAPSADERDVLALVAAGATDEVIARQLGISPRTLRRRLRELFAELGASNRFHAGVEAARRGWV